MKVLVPDLPTTDELIPFLRRIDANRVYSNSGPLVTELERRLDGVLVSSATLGLELSIDCLFHPGSAIRLPAFTFAATATAVSRVGRQPVLCDVDRDTWAAVDADLPVCPFGAPVTGGRLIDAAAAWQNQTEGNRVFSLHATKVLPAGEGGVVCGEPDLLHKVRALANFGIEDGRMASHQGGTNAKLSEYHAAVALASLERLPRVVAKRQVLEVRYRQNLAGVVEMQRRPIGSYAIFPVLVPERDRIARELAAWDIETRSWYCPTLNEHPAWANLHTDGPLTVTKMLSDSLLCLPFHTFMSLEDVDEVCDRLRAAVRARYEFRAA